jgi:predicted porin
MFSVAGIANAESSVTLYGIIDAGITVVNNQKGHLNYKMDSGVMQGNRWGLIGKEELTRKLSALFNVEGGYNLDNGNFPSDNKIFGRKATVGLEYKGIGNVKFGRQVDFMDDMAGLYAISGNQYATTLTFRAHKRDRIDGQRFDNSIRFQSEKFSGLSAGVMIGLGETAGSFKTNRGLSVMVGYSGVPNLNTSLAYTRIDKSVGNQSIFAAGINYDFGFGKANVLATTAKDTSVSLSNPDKVNVYEVGYKHVVTPKLSVGVGYQYLDEKTQAKKSDDMNNFTAALDYAFSKRTDTYLTAVIGKAKGNAVLNVTGVTGEESDSRNQVAVRAGFRHKF